MILDWKPVSVEPKPNEPVLVRSKEDGKWDYDIAVNIEGEWWQKQMCYRIEGVTDYAVLEDS